MFIKKLELINVQKHQHIIIDLCSGVNVLWGKTDSGKSCIIHALRWILTNDFSSDSIRKDGTKKTIVSITLDNDIIVSRIRSDSVNRYEVLFPDGTKEKYDSVGRIIPDKIKDLFNMPIMKIENEEIILNIHGQDNKYFLLNEKATFRNKILNILTGNNLLDKIIKSFNTDLFTLNRKEKNFQENIKKNTTKLSSIKLKLSTNRQLLNKVLNKFNNLKIMKEEIEEIEKVFINYCETHKLINNLVNQIKEIKIPLNNELWNKIEYFDKINDLYFKLLEIQELIKKIQNEVKMEVPKIPKMLANVIETLDNLNDISLRLNKIKDLKLKLIEEKNVLKSQIRTIITKYNKIVAEIPIIRCPKCNTEIKELQVKEIKE